MTTTEKCKDTIAGSTPWLFIIQVALLVLYYGMHYTLPWWVLFLPALIWTVEALVILVILAGVGIFMLVAYLYDSLDAPGLSRLFVSIFVGIVCFVVLGVAVYYIWTVVVGFLSGFV